MIRRLDYVRAESGRKIPPVRSHTPQWAALAFAALFIIGWSAFFTSGSANVIHSHFTIRPQDFPQFRLTPWRKNKSPDGLPLWTRDAILPLTMHTLRYTQETADAGATIETTAYHADVRWGPTTVALIATAILPLVVYFGLKRAARIQPEIHG